VKSKHGRALTLLWANLLIKIQHGEVMKLTIQFSIIGFRQDLSRILVLMEVVVIILLGGT
jgi:hypothetical protein